jgi:5-methylthioadenosine/S-adenosylhomocysteine deaminase
LTTEGNSSPRIVEGNLAIAGNRIDSIQTKTADSDKHQPENSIFIDGKGFIAIPGLINVHTHAAMGFFRGLGHGRTDMIENFLFPAEKALTPELLEPLSWSYLVACLRAGVTCISDHYYMIAGVGHALERIGMRGFIGETIADLGGAFPGWDSWKRAREMIDAWPFNDLVQPVVAPHAADTVSVKLLREAALFARSRKLTLHMHLSQTTGELHRVKTQDNMTPVQKAFTCEALSDRTLAVHMISAREADFAEVRNAGATVVLCPASQIIYEHIAPLDRIAATGVQWAVATDCAASNDGGDVLADCKLLGLLARDRKIHEHAFTPERLLAAITTVPSRALGMAGHMGVLQKGSLADIVLLRDDMSMRPHGHEIQNLIYSSGAGGIEYVMINGAWRLWNRELPGLNEDQLTAEFDRAVAEIKKRTGITR